MKVGEDLYGNLSNFASFILCLLLIFPTMTSTIRLQNICLQLTLNILESLTNLHSLNLVEKAVILQTSLCLEGKHTFTVLKTVNTF